MPGPNADRDLRLARLEFIQTIGELDQGSRNYVGVPQILQERARLAVNFAPLLREPAYRSILDLELSRVLAGAGGVQEAVGLLRSAWSELRRGAIGGHRAALALLLYRPPATAPATPHRNSVPYFGHDPGAAMLAGGMLGIRPVAAALNPPEQVAAAMARAGERLARRGVAYRFVSGESEAADALLIVTGGASTSRWRRPSGCRYRCSCPRTPG